MFATLLCLLPLLAQPEIQIPTGPEVVLDGRPEAAEWEGAFHVTRTIPGGRKLEFRLMRSGPWLAFGISAEGPYDGEILRLYVADEEGDWVVAVHCGLANPTMPPMIWRRGPPKRMRSREIMPQAGRGCRVRALVEEPDHWSVECLVRLTSLGIGRGDLRTFGGHIALGTSGRGRREHLTLPVNGKDPLDRAGYGKLVSPDGWGREESWAPVEPGTSHEFDDNALLLRLFLEHEGFRIGDDRQSWVIANVVHQRSRARIEALRRRMLDAQRRNPTLPAWRYYLMRLLMESTLYDEAGGMLAALPEPLARLEEFLRLSAEYDYDNQNWEKAIATAGRVRGAQGMGELIASARQGIEITAEEAKVLAADAAKTEKNPVVRVYTSKGSFSLELFEDDAPNAVRNFVNLVGAMKYYDGIRVHDASGSNYVSFGDPRSRKGMAVGPDEPDGPPWRLMPDEPGRPLLRGYLAAVPRPGNVFHGSHVTIALSPLLREGSKVTVFGRVTEGMEVVDNLDFGDRIDRIEILSKRNHNYDPLGCRVK